MGPDPVNKRSTHLQPRYFLTQSEDIFLDTKGENLTFLGEIFQTQTKTIDGWPDPTRFKNFWHTPITTFEQPLEIRKINQTAKLEMNFNCLKFILSVNLLFKLLTENWRGA